MKKVKYLLLGFSFLVLSASLFAQETENTGIEEIIVTARQQAESLQDVPVTVSVMSEMDLKIQIKRVLLEIEIKTA